MYSIKDIENDIKNSKIYEMEDFPIPCGRDSFYRDCMHYCKDKSGLFLEFGVYQGGTINFMSSILKNKIFYGFDSFEGLPEDWIGNGNVINEKGTFKTNIPKVNDNVLLIKGLFQETVIEFFNNNKTLISFVHIDCDLYSSVDYVLRNIENKIEDDCLIIFDDLINFPDYESHSIKAFSEFLNRNSYEYISNGIVIKEEFSRASFIIKKRNK
jgi:hypothetical protein